MMLTISACHIHWLQESKPFMAKLFRPTCFFSIRDGQFVALHMNEYDLLDEIICCFEDGSVCLQVDNNELREALQVVTTNGNYPLVVRGKYRLRLFEWWLRSLRGTHLPSGGQIRPGAIVNDILGEAMAVASAPWSLRTFLDAHLSSAYT